MSYIEGFSRKQTLLFPEVLDDYVTEDNLVLFIDAYVDELYLAELDFTQSIPKEMGSPPLNHRVAQMKTKLSKIEFASSDFSHRLFS